MRQTQTHTNTHRHTETNTDTQTHRDKHRHTHRDKHRDKQRQNTCFHLSRAKSAAQTGYGMPSSWMTDCASCIAARTSDKAIFSISCRAKIRQKQRQ